MTTNRVSHIKKESSVGKGIITGCMTIGEMLTGGLFMENLKMQKQLLAKPYSEVARTMLKGGLSGFWAGFIPWGAVLGLSKGIVLGSSKAIYQNKLLDLEYFSKKNCELIAGTLAGGTQGVFMGPLLLARLWVIEGMKQRIESGQKTTGLASEFNISMKILNDAIKDRGVGVLFTGMPTMLVKRSFDWGTRFAMMGIFKEKLSEFKGEYFGNERLGFWENLVCTFMGSGSSILLTQPMDKIVPVIQSQKKNGETVMSILRGQINKYGYIGSLWGGMGIRFVHIGWHTTWAIFISQIVFDSIYPK